MVKGLVSPRESSQKIEFCILTKDKKVQTRAFGIVEYYKQHIPYTFGQALCKCMEQTKMTVAVLSEKTGISERQIGRMRNDDVKDVSFRIIIALCVALNLTQDTAESLLNLKRYTLYCDEPYTQMCKLFLEIDISVSRCNEVLKSFDFEPLTDGEIWAA